MCCQYEVKQETGNVIRTSEPPIKDLNCQQGVINSDPHVFTVILQLNLTPRGNVLNPEYSPRS